ncbi:hypothetical protein FE257_008670 [Aspergillus nanangensis]|uniref:Uncharacterized protein n=1 Tax=Aspergillus nanangensis TaxID=2582783 RepID=A0AAD4CMN6_ASPNN|nr:hypothetical protein FE257_008670 [Aspergillus nanangensis]
MSPPSEQGQQTQFIFVGGPVLKEKGGQIRSKFLKQVRREKRNLRLVNATTELEALLKEERNPECTCGQELSGLMVEASLGYRPIMPKMSTSKINHERGHLCCSVCGRYLRPQGPSAGSLVRDLGAGSSNPMIPIDEMTSQLGVQEILNFTTTQIWPNFRPLGYTANCYQLWAFPFDDKVKLYAVLWSAAYYQDVLRLTYGGPEYQVGSKEQFRLKGLTLETLRKEVGSYTGATPIDSIIMCIPFLAVNETHGARLYRGPSPFAPTFTGLHALDIYGSRDYHALHWTVIQDLLRRFGGIQVLRVFALAWLLSISDIMNAAHTLGKPIYPAMGVDGHTVDLDPPLLLFAPYGVRSGQVQPGSGFDELLSLAPPVQQDLVSILAHVGELSHAMFLRGTM